MAILITGGNGYIGSHTCVELLNQGYDIVVLDNFCNSKPEVANRVKAITGRDYPLVEGDIRDEDCLRQVFATYPIEAVIHFAGLKAVGESTQNPLLYYDNNVSGTVTLCRVMAEAGCKRIVFSSSATVYNIDQPAPWQEDLLTGRVSNPYGRSKYIIEEILGDTCRSDAAWSAVLLRYFNPVGAHPSGTMGEDPNGIPNNLMPFVTQVAIGKRDKLSVFGNDYNTPDGTGVRDYLHVVDLARGHVCAVEYALTHTGAEAINLGTGTGYSVLDIVHAFEQANNLTIPYVIAPRRPGDIDCYFADPAKAERVLGWKAEKNLLDMCRDSWRWQSQNPQGYGD